MTAKAKLFIITADIVLREMEQTIYQEVKPTGKKITEENIFHVIAPTQEAATAWFLGRYSSWGTPTIKSIKPTDLDAIILELG